MIGPCRISQVVGGWHSHSSGGNNSSISVSPITIITTLRMASESGLVIFFTFFFSWKIVTGFWWNLGGCWKWLSQIKVGLALLFTFSLMLLLLINVSRLGVWWVCNWTWAHVGCPVMGSNSRVIFYWRLDFSGVVVCKDGIIEVMSKTHNKSKNINVKRIILATKIIYEKQTRQKSSANVSQYSYMSIHYINLVRCTMPGKHNTLSWAIMLTTTRLSVHSKLNDYLYAFRNFAFFCRSCFWWQILLFLTIVYFCVHSFHWLSPHISRGMAFIATLSCHILYMCTITGSKSEELKRNDVFIIITCYTCMYGAVSLCYSCTEYCNIATSAWFIET